MKNAESHMHIFIQYFHNSSVVCGRSGQHNSGNVAIIYFIIYKLVSFLLFCLVFFFFLILIGISSFLKIDFSVQSSIQRN